MGSVGVPLTILSFPSLDDFEEALASIPRYDDTEKLRQYNHKCSAELIQQRMNEYVESIKTGSARISKLMKNLRTTLLKRTSLISKSTTFTPAVR